MLIAIDGPAASGKGTVAKEIANHYKLDYFDTGTLYRAVGFKVLQLGEDLNNQQTCVKIAKTVTYEDTLNENLGSEEIGKAASIIASIEQVRSVLVEFQKEFAKSKKGAILDGRDIGTVICPDADFKFFITADIQARANRRFKQLHNAGKSVKYEGILNDLIKRDERDCNRNIAPLVQADDSIFIDTTNITSDEVVSKIVDFIDSKNI